MKIILVILGGLMFKTAGALASGYISLTNTQSALCLEIQNSSLAEGALLQQASCTGADNQIFYASTRADGAWTLKNKKSNLCVDFADPALFSGSALLQKKCVGSVSQNFSPLYRRSNVYSLISQLNSACVEIKDGSLSQGALTQAKPCALSVGQEFSFKILSGSLNLLTKLPTDIPIVPVTGPSLPNRLKGLNLTGAESGDILTKNTYGYDYMYPSATRIDYYAARGFTVIRVPFKSGRLQPVLNKPLDATELSRLDKVVQQARSKGLYVILDPHDYGMMLDASGVKQVIGSASMPAVKLADFWSRLAYVYKNQPNVIFGIMNEPHYQTATQWQSTAIASINAIRSVGARQLVLIPGTSWTGAHSWVSSGNAKTWTGFRDFNSAFEVHQYFDSNNSGTNEGCVLNAGTKRLAAFIDWAITKKRTSFVGEFGWSENSGCLQEGEKFMNEMMKYPGVFKGWTYFGAGWYNGYFTLNPINGVDRKQLPILQSAF